MATKLEKAQYRYEAVLRDLGQKAEMVGVVEKAAPVVLKNYKRAHENLSDRRIELEFLDSEIETLNAKVDGDLDDTKQRVTELKAEIKDLQELIDIKRSKSSPITKKLAGGEYDLKFIVRALEDEKRKEQEKKRREEFKAAKEHEENIKRLKIEVLKRKKAIMDMKREFKEYETPAKKMEKEVEQLKEEFDRLKDELAEKGEADSADLLGELERQREAKQKDVDRAEQHLRDVLADVGEDLYERRIKHPVLNKYYADLDVVAETIDKLQE